MRTTRDLLTHLDSKGARCRLQHGWLYRQAPLNTGEGEKLILLASAAYLMAKERSF